MKNYTDMNVEELDKEIKLNRIVVGINFFVSFLLLFGSLWQKSYVLLLICIVSFILNLFLWVNSWMLVILKQIKNLSKGDMKDEMV